MDERVALARGGRLSGETPDNAGRMPALPGEMWKRCFVRCALCVVRCAWASALAERRYRPGMDKGIFIHQEQRTKNKEPSTRRSRTKHKEQSTCRRHTKHAAQPHKARYLLSMIWVVFAGGFFDVGNS